MEFEALISHVFIFHDIPNMISIKAQGKRDSPNAINLQSDWGCSYMYVYVYIYIIIYILVII